MSCNRSPQNIRSHLRDPGRLLPLLMSSWGELWLLVHNEDLALEGCNACLVGGSAIDSLCLHRQSHHFSTQSSQLACSFCRLFAFPAREVCIQQVPPAGCSGMQPQKGVCFYITGFEAVAPGLHPLSSLCREHAEWQGGGGCHIPSTDCPPSHLTPCCNPFQTGEEPQSSPSAANRSSLLLALSTW